MNERYSEMILEIGYPNEQLITITPGQTFDTFPLKKIKIGVVSRGGYPGYGQEFMERFFSNKELESFEFFFLGSGWKNIKEICEKKNLKISIQDDIDYEVYPLFYEKIDYLLIPGLWTAGPMSFQEALSCGVPVISSDVGFAGFEFDPDFIFEPNNIDELYNIFLNILKPRLERRKQVENMTWDGYAQKIKEFIENLKK